MQAKTSPPKPSFLASLSVLIPLDVDINAIPKPFVLNYTSSACDAAMDACDEVVNALNAANDYIQNSKD